MKKALLEEHVRYGEARFRDKELVRPFVNRIYQDLAELEEAMKPKTCYECEWWDFNSYGIFKKCFNGEGNCASTKSSFGCNRFKQKDNA